MAIILVNLTFADAELRRDLADPELSVISSLAYVLKVSSLPILDDAKNDMNDTYRTYTDCSCMTTTPPAICND